MSCRVPSTADVADTRFIRSHGADVQLIHGL